MPAEIVIGDGQVLISRVEYVRERPHTSLANQTPAGVRGVRHEAHGGADGPSALRMNRRPRGRSTLPTTPCRLGRSAGELPHGELGPANGHAERRGGALLLAIAVRELAAVPLGS